MSTLSDAKWPIVFGAAFGLGVSYLLVQSRQLDAAIAKLSEVTKDLRLPDPGYAVHLPITQQDFARLDEMACACLSDADTTASLPLIADAVALCITSQLYADFSWPPMTGDHPSVTELWQACRVIATRQLATSACSPSRR